MHAGTMPLLLHTPLLRDRGASRDVTMTTIGLISCTKSKLPSLAPARDLYSPSWVFRRSVAYVERHCSAWWVLSAKHGLLHPDKAIEPYDETLTSSTKAQRAAWAAPIRAMLTEVYPGARFVLLAGAAYAGAVEGLDHVTPMARMGTGHRRRWLKNPEQP